MKVMRRWQYFTGSYPCPQPINPDKPTKDKVEATAQWEYDDSVSSSVAVASTFTSCILRNKIGKTLTIIEEIAEA
jgi:hypothetical protein